MSYGKLWWQSPHKKSWAVREHLNWGCFPRAGKPGSRGDSGAGRDRNVTSKRAVPHHPSKRSRCSDSNEGQ